MEPNDTAWPVANDDIPPWTPRHSLRRQVWISDADRLIAEAAELADDTAQHPYSESHAKRIRKAARLYAKSARFYRQAGLGIMAQGSLQDAAICYARLGDDEQCEQCEQLAEEIDTFYEEN